MKTNWPTKKAKMERGGDAGEIFIAARKIIGDGKIMADGGDGSIGGRGGRVTLITENNKFSGEISAKGGKSLSESKKWYERWYGILILGIIASAIVSIFFYFL